MCNVNLRGATQIKTIENQMATSKENIDSIFMT